MKLYLSSYRIPRPDALEELLGKCLSATRIALIPNAKDYYAELAWNYKVSSYVDYMASFGVSTSVIDLRLFNNPAKLQDALMGYDMVWVAGGNTYCLRYEMKRSGFDLVIKDLLLANKVYGGESAGALCAGVSIKGIESADVPQFAKAVIEEGLGLVPYVILPHADNTAFMDAVSDSKNVHKGVNDVIELKDSQAVIFEGDTHHIIESPALLNS